jgi:phage baseplate assembly protein W
MEAKNFRIGNLIYWDIPEKNGVIHEITKIMFNRINTIVGELPIHPEYGSKLPLLVSTPGKQEFVDNLRNEINDALLQDQRISQVITSEVNISGSFVSVKSEVVLTGRADSSVFIFPNFYIE